MRVPMLMTSRVVAFAGVVADVAAVTMSVALEAACAVLAGPVAVA